MSHIPYYNTEDDTKMSKNGFEIRADIFAMAKDYIEKQTQLNIDYANKMFELNKIQLDEYQKAIQPYSMADIMDKAQEIYSFVSKK